MEDGYYGQLEVGWVVWSRVLGRDRWRRTWSDPVDRSETSENDKWKQDEKMKWKRDEEEENNDRD